MNSIHEISEKINNICLLNKCSISGIILSNEYELPYLYGCGFKKANNFFDSLQVGYLASLHAILNDDLKLDGNLDILENINEFINSIQKHYELLKQKINLNGE